MCAGFTPTINPQSMRSPMAVTQEKTKKRKEGGRVAATPPCQDRVGPSRTNSAHEEVRYSTQRALGRPRGRPDFAAIAERDTIDGRALVKRRRALASGI